MQASKPSATCNQHQNIAMIFPHHRLQEYPSLHENENVLWGWLKLVLAKEEEKRLTWKLISWRKKYKYKYYR
ncbi:hypothetical protein K1719_026568 [Acacia pycnantha]|nr:hypothetical protein K1719_026568 [Acacia pycnantha]